MDTQHVDILKKYYGYPNFRIGQEEIITTILGGRDCLAVMPTGAGKSLCFQIPALIFEGISLVISPLISLMRDQVAALKQNGVAAAFINSSLTYSQTEKALERARNYAYKIIYVAPERLDTASFVEFAHNVDISMVAVDEAHCVSHWGQDFRPSYLNITTFVAALPKRPIIAAFTATATDVVKSDIARLLDLCQPFVMTTGFNRDNLYFEVRRPRDKYAELSAYLRGTEGKSGIVYCATRKNVNEVAARLTADGFSASPYHAGLSQGERITAQDDFVYDRKNVIVATNAFGMGIDKSNVSFVVHYNMPKNMESYYQEAGRAGRDGSPADCILLFSPQDIVINRFLIAQTDADSPLSPEELAVSKARDYKRLKQIEAYCKTADCLRRYILDYFGDNENVSCDNCGNCQAERKVADITIEAQKILSCVYRINERYGITTLVDILIGAKTTKLIKTGLDKIKSYGIMSEKDIRKIREIIDFLIQSGYMSIVGDEYPVVKLSEKAKPVLFDNENVLMTVLDDISEGEDILTSRQFKRSRRGGRGADSSKINARQNVLNPELFTALKKLRYKLAGEEKVPAFVIFSDATLVDMCIRMPSNEAEFLGVSGVGQVKLDKYGAVFLAVINRFDKQTITYQGEQPETIDTKNIILFINENFEFFDEPVKVSIFVDRINALLLQKWDKRITAKKITDRLLSDGYLETREIGGKTNRVASEKGMGVGIESIQESRADGREYFINNYGVDAQKIMLGYVENIISEV